MSNKLNKIWLKKLNPHYFKNNELNKVKVLKKNNFNFYSKLRNKKQIKKKQKGKNRVLSHRYSSWVKTV